MGSYAGGHRLFKAKLVDIRPHYPRLVIEYLSDESGSTHPLALPSPVTAWVHAGMVQALE